MNVAKRIKSSFDGSSAIKYGDTVDSGTNEVKLGQKAWAGIHHISIKPMQS